MTLPCVLSLKAQPQNIRPIKTETIKVESHISGLRIGLQHLPAKTKTGTAPVLFIHGSSFPSELAFGFRMNGESWMDNLSEHNFDSYAIDFLGYGCADRYPQIIKKATVLKAPGMAVEAYLDVDKAVDYILAKTGAPKVILIGHSWGGSVAALYAEKFPEKVLRLVLFAPITVRSSHVKPAAVTGPYESITPDARVRAMQLLTPVGKKCRLEPEMFGEWKKEWLRTDSSAYKKHPAAVSFPSGPDQDFEDLDHGKTYYQPSLIKSPVLIIRGEWDDYCSDEDALRLIDSLKGSPEKRYVIVGRGTHVMHLEQSRHRLYDEVLQFISRSDGVIIQRRSGIAVIFEVIPNEGKKDEYLSIAAKLKPELQKIDGFISIERFQSLTHPEKILSLSFWRDEEAISAWRNLELHREAQSKGRNGIFKDYHLRIADVVRDYGQFDREEAPIDSKAYHQ